MANRLGRVVNVVCLCGLGFVAGLAAAFVGIAVDRTNRDSLADLATRDVHDQLASGQLVMRSQLSQAVRSAAGAARAEALDDAGRRHVVHIWDSSSGRVAVVTVDGRAVAAVSSVYTSNYQFDGPVPTWHFGTSDDFHASLAAMLPKR